MKQLNQISMLVLIAALSFGLLSVTAGVAQAERGEQGAENFVNRAVITASFEAHR